MNMPCAVSGLIYAVRPPPIAPICVLNIRFIALTSDHLDCLQVGHSTPCDNSAITSSGDSESGFSCLPSTKWSALKALVQAPHSTIRSLNSLT